MDREFDMRIACLLAILLFSQVLTAPVSAQVIYFDENDPAMQQAIADARSTLPLFFEQSSDKDPSVSMLKVGVPYAEGVEHIWMSYCRATQGSALACVFANDPQNIPYKLGDTYTFGLGDISDWMWFDEHGRIHGGYTIRAMLPKLPADQAAGLREQLAPLPN